MAPTFEYSANAQTTLELPLVDKDNSFLGDVFTSENHDPQAPITSGFYRHEKGTTLVHDYTYNDMKIVLDGSFDISDEAGKKVHATKGDVFYFLKGSKITFESEDFGLAFLWGRGRRVRLE